MKKKFYGMIIIILSGYASPNAKLSELSVFYKPAQNTILIADSTFVFYNSVKQQQVKWQKADAFNPAAIVKDGKVNDVKITPSKPHTTSHSNLT